MIDNSCYKIEGDKKLVKFNSVDRYIAFTMKIISLYTDLEIDFSNGEFVKQYDELNKIGAIHLFMKMIPQSEIEEFMTIMDMMLDDLKNNEYSLTAIVYSFKESINLSSEAFEKAIDEIKNIESND